LKEAEVPTIFTVDIGVSRSERRGEEREVKRDLHYIK
jgi:hypothetical protein